MKIEQKKWSPESGWETSFSSIPDKMHPHLILAFGDRYILSEKSPYQELRKMYPEGHIVLTSTSGNIIGVNLEDNCINSTAIFFEKESEIKIHRTNIKESKNSFSAGEFVGKMLPKEGLLHVLLLSDGHLVNGSELVKGLESILPPEVTVTGGLAGDGTRFEKTLVGVNDNPQEGEIVGIGFYGKHLKFGFGSVGGWDPFGIERKITRSEGNILYELDGKPALELYRKYLGEEANNLPSAALFFPLAVRENQDSPLLVRTILSINEEDQSMVFAGDVPQGWYAQLMKANFDRLLNGAQQAANSSIEELGERTPELAILISCVGRRLVLDQRTEEEIESVQNVLGNNTAIIGFYSYGEIAPFAHKLKSELLNQTMTITSISER